LDDPFYVLYSVGQKHEIVAGILIAWSWYVLGLYLSYC